MSFSQQAATNAWVIQQAVDWVAKVFLLLALVGLYGYQANKTRRFGFARFLVVFLGITLLFGTIWGFWILAPALARDSGEGPEPYGGPGRTNPAVASEISHPGRSRGFRRPAANPPPKKTRGS